MEKQWWSIELSDKQVKKISELIDVEIYDDEDLEYAISRMLEQL